MKKSSVIMIAAALILSSCGTFTQLISSSEGQKFQDGIYASTPDFISKEEKVQGKAETEELIAKTKESPVYLFGDRKDSIVIPDNYSATIKYDKSLSSTVVTVSENPYDWRNNLNPWSYYTPYSIGSSWYWSRHWDPDWSLSWRYSWHDPWFYGWSDPWYYGGYWGRWYDPFDYWGFWGWNSPWYYTGYWGYPWYPHYAGWYGGFGPHYHGHIHGGPGLGHGGHFSSKMWYGPRHETQRDERVFTDSGKTTVRRGVGTSSSSSRGVIGNSTTSRSSVTASKSSGGNSAVRRTVTRQNAAVASGSQTNQTKPAATTGSRTNYRRPAVSSGNQASAGSSYSRSSGSNTQSRGTVGGQSTTSRSSNTYERSTSSNERSSSNTTRSSSYSSGGGGGYSRSSAGGGGYSGGGASRSGGSAGGRR